METSPHPRKNRKEVWLSLPRFWLRHPGKLKIGLRLVLCFAFIVLLMLVADIVALWQFNQVRIQAHLLNDINRKSVSVLELHSNLLLFRDRLASVASAQDPHAFDAEAIAQRMQLLADTERARLLLTAGDQGADRDPMILSTLQAIQSALPDQIDTMIALARQGDWEAVHLRLENQTKALILLSSSLVEKVDQEVANGRAIALSKIQRSQRRVILVLPITVSITLLTAVILGILVTRSITRPLARLDAGAQAWARGEFHYQVDANGQDELAVLGRVFNSASQRLHQLYETLKSNEARFRSLIEHSSDVIALLDSQGIVRYASPSSERVIGLQPEELVGKNLLEFVQPEDQPVAQELLSTPTTGALSRAELRFLHPNGSTRILEVIARNLLEDPTTAAIVLNARDVTERRRAEEALVLSEEKYRSFFEQNPAGTYISSVNGEILDCNPALVRMFGFPSAQELEETNLSTLFSSRENYERFLQQLKSKHRLESYEEEYRRKDGSSLPVSANAIGSFNEQGELVEIRGFLIDETERRRTEKHLLQVQKMEAIGRLAGGIAHDFNNLLGIILGSSSLILEDKDTPPPFRREIQDILDASRHAASLTRQLLAFSRKQVLQPTILDLNHVVQDVDTILRRLIGEDIEIKTVLAPDLASVKADFSQIEQVILNLCVNARDAMPNGGLLTIATTNIGADAVFAAQHIPMKPGQYVRLSVSDTGIGMDKATLSHIFEPFFTTKGPEKGTGLGLSTVYGIVKQSGGYISAYSEPRQGTSIFVYLPAVENVAEPVTSQIKPSDAMRGTETILLVEDAAALRTLTRKILETCGYKVLDAEDAKQAIQLIEKNTPHIDLLLTDVIMPHMSGPALARYLLAKRPGLKVLFMSGYTDDAIADNGLLKPGAVLLEKPFTMQALTEKIREVLDTPNTTNTDSD